MGRDKRVVLFGPPLCGKTTLLTAYARWRGLSPERVELACGAAGLRHWVLRARSMTAGTELITIPGAVWSPDAWWSLVGDASAVALVLDSQAVREEADCAHLTELANAPRCPSLGCVVWTKMDLVTKGGVDRVPTLPAPPAPGAPLRGQHETSATMGATMASWPTFMTRSDDAASLLAPLRYLVERLEA